MTFKKNLTYDIMFIFVILSFSFISFYRYLSEPFGYDGKFFYWNGWNILNGRLPYRDFFEFKPPLIMYLNALAIIISKGNIFLFSCTFFLLPCVSLIVFYATMVRLSKNRLVSLLMTFSLALLIFSPKFHDWTLNDTETCGISFTIIGFCLAHWFSIPQNVKSPMSLNLINFLAGLLFSLAVLSKEPFILIVGSIVILKFIYDSQSNLKIGFANLLMTGCGIIVGLSCFVIYLLYNNLFFYYIDSIVTSFRYAGNYARDIGLLTTKSWIETLAFDFEKLAKGYSYGIPFLGILSFYFPLFFSKKLFLLNISLLLSILSCLFVVSLGHCFWSHYFVMGILGFLIPAVYGATLISGNHILISSNTKQIIIGFAITGTIILFFQRAQFISENKVSIKEYKVPIDFSNAVQQFTDTNDKILIISDSPLYLSLLNREHSTKWGTLFDELLPLLDGKTQIEKLQILRDEIISNNPKVILIEKTFLINRQKIILGNVIVPIIQSGGYLEINPGVFIKQKLN